MGWLRFLALAALCCAAPVHAQNAAPRSVFVDPDEFRCLVDNIDSVPREERGVFVDFQDCRRDGGVKIIRLLFTPTPRPNPKGTEGILLVTPKELQCLKRFRRNPMRLLQVMPGDRHRLMINPCGQVGR